MRNWEEVLVDGGFKEAQQIVSMHLDLVLGLMVPGPVTADTGVL